MPEPGHPDSRFDQILAEAGCGRRVIAHCHGVRSMAHSFCDSSSVADRELVNAGALLHDIGRGVTHSLTGQRQTASEDEMKKQYDLIPISATPWKTIQTIIEGGFE